MPSAMRIELGPVDWPSTDSLINLDAGAGIIAGLVHHFTCQYPGQRDVLTTFYLWALINSTIIALLILRFPNENLLNAFFAFFAFNGLYITVATSCKLFYNIFFRHRGIPTKLELCATDWGFCRYGRKGIAHLKVAELHCTLGDVVRIQPNHISFRSLEAYEDIHSTHTKASKGDMYDDIFRPAGVPSGLFDAVDKLRHAILRRIVGPSFSNVAMTQFEPTLKRYVQQFKDALQGTASENNGRIDMTDWFNRFTFDIGGALTLGQNFGALKGGDLHFCLQAFHLSFNFVRTYMYVSWLAKFILLLPPPRILRESRLKTLKFSTDAIDIRRKEGDQGDRTIIGNIMKAKDPITGQKFTELDLIANANSFIIAAADTTAGTLTFLLYHLVANPPHWNRLLDELLSNFNSMEEFSNARLANLPFLEALIYETTRLRPAAPSNLQRKTPPEGMMVGGRFVPGNTIISTPTYAILHDERNFSNPEKFIPTRWIDAERGEERCNRNAWVSFSHGARSCIGKPLALMELRYAIAMFVWNFDAQLADVGQKEPYYKDAFAVLRGPNWLRITPVTRKVA